MESTDDLYPIAVLIDELKNEEMALRLNSLRRLGTIALALGEDRTREELIPFLNESIDDEDEVLQVLAEELGNMVPYVGGAEHAFHLLPPLEQLATVEETLVRDKAVESLCKVAEELSPSSLQLHYVPLVTRLSKAEWFTSRVSACGLFAAAYEKCNPEMKAELRAGYNMLCNDETPMVRRASAQHLGAYAAKLEKNLLETDVMTMFTNLTQDDQDSVRLLAVESCSPLAKLLGKGACVSKILPIVQKFSADKSWRVRYMTAQQIYDLCEMVGRDITISEVVPSYGKLLRDNEAEVRIAAAGKVSHFCAFIGAEASLREILPSVKELAGDTSQHVRAVVAGMIMGIAPILGRNDTIDQLLPVILDLLRDEYPDVRLNIISKLEQVINVIGINLLQKNLLPAIVALAEDKHWRVRLAIMEYFPQLASILGVSNFDTVLGNLCINWLKDQVHAIRHAAATNLKKLAETFGHEWVQEFVMPALLDKVQNPHYLYRMTILEAIAAMSGTVKREVLTTVVLPEILKTSSDAVPNVRFHGCKLMKTMIPHMDKNTVENTVKPWLTDLQEDDDHDVQFFSRDALTACQ
eukprot:CAMPEP_0198236830 /NCGR_PEP_ID=MMETSP1446-20131203/2724_1 /TAXON_ID=1461542 ORGANISM="Unidentified sp, Strain CCMP2111" /NCGR_SAMPLE_ID=MMETSP1446 /ASSEMBLY_ACC=CAM_ASM_001112 /LENGTH=580 /DNA_ID=CAMNT_0043918779 /DNA_START=110 /DNA_END=1852 /DNA_ORIENTATION=-